MGSFRRRIGLGLVLVVLSGTAASGTLTTDEAVSRFQDPSNNAYLPNGTAAPPLDHAWTKDLDGTVTYALVADGRAFVITAGSEWGSHSLHAFDVHHGNRLWGPIDLGSGWGRGPSTFYTLAFADGMVFVQAHTTIIAFDADTGSKVWTTYAHAHRYAGSPLPVGNLLIVQGHESSPGELASRVVALRQSDGKVAWWRYTLNSSLATDGRLIYATDGCYNVDTFDAVTGEPGWTRTTGCHGPGETAVVEGNKLLLLSPYPNQEPVILDATSGAETGSFASDSIPVHVGTITLFRVGGELRAEDVDANHGSRDLWTSSGDGNLTGSPLVVGDTVYMLSSAGSLFALDLGTGGELWHDDLGAPADDLWQGGLASGAGSILVSAGDKLVAMRSTDVVAQSPITPLPRPSFVLGTATARNRATSFHQNRRHDRVIEGRDPRPPLNKLWSRDLGGEVSYPLMVEGKIFVTANGVTSAEPRLHAFNARTGRRAWKAIDVGNNNPNCSFAHATYDKGTVYSLSVCGRLLAVDASSGRVRWRRRLSGSYGGAIAMDFIGPPTAANGLVYVTADGYGSVGFAINGATGRIRWTRAIRNGGPSSPTVAGRSLYLSSDCAVEQFDALTGERGWIADEGCSGPRSLTAVVKGGKAYIRHSTTDNAVLDTRAGKQTGSFSSRTLPVVHGSRAFYVVGGQLRAVDRRTGVIAWTFKRDLEIASTPVIVGKALYVVSEDAHVYAVSISSGRTLWERDLRGKVLIVEQPYDDHAGKWIPYRDVAIGEGRLAIPVGRRIIVFG